MYQLAWSRETIWGALQLNFNVILDSVSWWMTRIMFLPKTASFQEDFLKLDQTDTDMLNFIFFIFLNNLLQRVYNNFFVLRII